jgi:hypothetical protein
MKTMSWVLAMLAVVAGCGASGGSLGARPLANGAAYLESNRIVWLTPEQRSYILCRDGQALLCEPALGRLSSAKCQCPATTPHGAVAH